MPKNKPYAKMKPGEKSKEVKGNPFAKKSKKGKK